MKKLLLFGYLIFALLFQSCKNSTTNQEEVTLDETEQILPQSVESTTIETTTENVEDSSAIVGETVKSGTTSKEVITTEVTTTKTTEKTVKPVVVETKPVLKEDPKKPEVVVVEKPVLKEDPKKPEVVVVEKPVTKPVEEKPIVVADASDWIVPAKYKTMKNPTDAKDSENMAIGKALYAKQCSSCHGKKGWGDGSKAAEMKGDLGDFSSNTSQKSTDGELYYKITAGRNDMPAFDKKITLEEDRWLVVNFLRTLAK